ncbi:MAG: GNAT family N-acetyltransferase [Anaerolineales bacterium]
MKIRYREATAADYKNLFDLFDEIDTLHRDNLPRRFKKANGPAREQDYYLELIDNENTGLFVAEMGEELVGFVKVIVRDTPPIPIILPRRYAVVDSIVVKSGFQKHGIGRNLMDKMQEWAVEKGATSVELNVYEFNETAVSFYERLGYKTVSRKMSKGL